MFEREAQYLRLLGMSVASLCLRTSRIFPELVVEINEVAVKEVRPQTLVLAINKSFMLIERSVRPSYRKPGPKHGLSIQFAVSTSYLLYQERLPSLAKLDSYSASKILSVINVRISVGIVLSVG